MGLLSRLKGAFRPASHDNTMSHYINGPDFSYQPVVLSVWRSDLRRPRHDWKGNTGRLYDNQVQTLGGPLVFALKGVTTAPLAAYSGLPPYGQLVNTAVAGYAGRPAQLSPYSGAAEYEANNATSLDAVVQATQGE